MRQVWLLVIALVLVAGDVFGQGSPNTTFQRSGDTVIAKTNNARIPVYLKVGRRPDDPFPTYKKAFLAADSVGLDSHYVVASSWLSIPIATSTLQHALAAEIYYTAESGTQTNNLVGQELSVNVPGRLVYNKATQNYGIYGLIINGKPTTTQGNGFIQTRRFVGLYIDLADVGAGEVDSVRADSQIGIWIPRLDAGTNDSGFAKYSFIGMNNMYVDDTVIVRDQIILGGNGTDSAWFGPDTIRGITTWTTKGATVPVINSRGNTAETGLLRLYGDSNQVRILHTTGATFIQFGDSAFTASDSLYIAGYNNTNLSKLELRADGIYIRYLGGETWRLPNEAPSNGEVLKIAVIAGPDTTYWDADAGAGAGLDSSTAEPMFINEYGDTTQAGKTYNLNRSVIDSTARVTAETLYVREWLYVDSIQGFQYIAGTGPDSTVMYFAFPLHLETGENYIKFIDAGGLEQFRFHYDSIVADTGGRIIGFAKLDANAVYTDTIVGTASGNPTLGDTLDLDQNDIIDVNKVTTDSLDVGTIVGEGLPDGVGAMVTGNTETGIAVTYQDADNTIDFVVTETGDIEGVTAGVAISGGGTSGTVTVNVDTASAAFDEAVSDRAGEMVTGNTESGVIVTYQDADNTLDFLFDTTFVDFTTYVSNHAGAGSGDITDVGSVSTGAAFNGGPADDQWLGLGAAAGRIQFDSMATGAADDRVEIPTGSLVIGDEIGTILNGLYLFRGSTNDVEVEFVNRDSGNGSNLYGYFTSYAKVDGSTGGDAALVLSVQRGGVAASTYMAGVDRSDSFALKIGLGDGLGTLTGGIVLDTLGKTYFPSGAFSGTTATDSQLATIGRVTKRIPFYDVASDIIWNYPTVAADTSMHVTFPYVSVLDSTILAKCSTTTGNDTVFGLVVPFYIQDSCSVDSLILFTQLSSATANNCKIDSVHLTYEAVDAVTVTALTSYTTDIGGSTALTRTAIPLIRTALPGEIIRARVVCALTENGATVTIRKAQIKGTKRV